jgi:hypothetical protein
MSRHLSPAFWAVQAAELSCHEFAANTPLQFVVGLFEKVT